MGEFDAGLLIASFLISGTGFVFFSYGKKMTRAPQMLVGLVLLVYPYFVSQLWILLGVFVLLVALLVLALKLGY